MQKLAQIVPLGDVFEEGAEIIKLVLRWSYSIILSEVSETIRE
jgi:hypothetical protein